MKHVKLGLSGIVTVSSLTVENQVTYEGAHAVLNAMAFTSDSPKVTNVMFLKDFVMPVGITDERLLTWAHVERFIAPEAYVGSYHLPSDINPDMRVYVSTEDTVEMTTIATIPAERAISDPTFNAAVLVMSGNEQSTTSTGGPLPVLTGSEKLFAIVQFPPITKDPMNPFVLVWYTRIE